MKKVLFAFILLIVFGIGLWIGNKERVFVKCPQNQVVINGLCFTPGEYYATGISR